MTFGASSRSLWRLATVPVLPPRPNLGPEPLAIPGTATASAVTTILVALALFWVVRRVHARSPESRRPRPARAASSPEPMLSAWAEKVRSRLVERYPGTPWESRTTEEIAVDPTLVELLGAERFAELVQFLRAVDRQKFASEKTLETQEREAWAGWAARFVADKERGAGSPSSTGARSTIRGK